MHENEGKVRPFNAPRHPQVLQNIEQVAGVPTAGRGQVQGVAKQAKLELPDVDAVFVTDQDAQALVTAAHYVMNQPDREALDGTGSSANGCEVDRVALGKQCDGVDTAARRS